MSSSSPSSLASPPPSALKAILWGAVISGTLDLIWAIGSRALQGMAFRIIPQAIASGLLGVKSFSDGTPAVVLGIFLEYVITCGAAATYYLVSRKMRWLVDRALLAGVLYGAAIFAFMHLVVLPLSRAPHFTVNVRALSLDFIAHLVIIGPPIALAVKKFGK